MEQVKQLTLTEAQSLELYELTEDTVKSMCAVAVDIDRETAWGIVLGICVGRLHALGVSDEQIHGLVGTALVGARAMAAAARCAPFTTET